MKMEGGIDPDAPLDYVELQIFPSQNRYEACVCSSGRAGKVAFGTLGQLLLHSPRVKDLSSKGLNMNFKILPPDNANDAEWFTTAKFKRFLHVVGSPDILSIGNEIAQLDETRKFQLSLSVKGEVDTTSSIDSKNELLKAVDLRIAALKDELVAAFNEATGAICSTKDISDLENFAHHFGAKDIRDSLQKFVEMSVFPSFEESRNINIYNTEKTSPTPQRSQMNPPIKYVSPAKAAQIERQESTDDENEHSSFSSKEEEQPSLERTRSRTRSATPRRSASPMRRVQIGRSGSHRAAALTIKSLNYFPVREKTLFQRDADCDSSDNEDAEKPAKNNVLRMSVQDKISLFESKQRDQGVDVPKTKTLLNTRKAVLRRWSSGMGESATKRLDSNTETSPSSPKNIAPEPESDCIFESQISSKTPENIRLHSPEIEEICETHPASIEWNQQKEEELNQLFMKMMESKPVIHENMTSDVNKGKKLQREQKGGFYDHYKQKRDEKLRGKASRKKSEKEDQFKVMQRFLDEQKTVNSVSKRLTTVNKPQKTQKNSTIPSTNSRKEPLKPSVSKKSTSKPSPLPATRKSWPSTPSPGTTISSSPAKTPTASTTPTSRKPSPLRSTTKSEKPQPRSKTPKSTPPIINEKKQPTVTKNTKKVKPKARTTPEVSTAKPSLYSKVTKKSSVVPLETKPFLRKGSGIKPKVMAQPEGSSGILIKSEENKAVITTDISQNQDACGAPEICDNQDSKPQVVKDSVSSDQFNTSSDDGEVTRVKFSEINTGTEVESMISPTAWVEVEVEGDHCHEEEIVSLKESPLQTESPVKVVGVSSPRVRHSLSQMLLEESNEGDVGECEWGNAEHPPSLVYQKDSPKGFKRLLKFARKTKADSHLTAWSSPPEGDDDAEDSKGQSNNSRFTSQNHPKVPERFVSASANTTKATRPFFSLSAFRGSKTNESKVV